MKKIFILNILLLLVIKLGFSQGLTNWKHYYATPYNGIDIGNYIASGVPGELILMDKTTLNITRIPFPADIRALNPDLDFYTGNISNGPGNYLILSAGPNANTYVFDGTNFIPTSSYQGFNIKNIAFFPNSGGSTFFISGNTLNKWNGTTLTTYDSTNSPFNSNYIDYKMTAPNDDIFLGEANSKVSIYHGGVWTDYDTTFFNDHIVYIQTYAGSPNSDFTFYNPYDTLVHTFQNLSNSWVSFRIPASVKHSVYNTNPESLLYDSNGDLWISGDSLFCKYDGTNFYDYFSYLPSGLTPNINIQNNLSANNLFLCLSDLNNVVHKYTFNSVSFTLIPFIDPHAVLPGNSLYLSVKDNAGNLWFSDDDSPTKIIKYDGIWNSIPINQYLSVVNTIKKDTGSSIILGGSSIGLLNGPIILNDTTFKSLDPTNTIVGTVQDIAIDNNHHYWCLMTNELIDWHNGIATSHYIATYHQANIFDIDSIGNKWVGIDSVFSSPGIGYGVLILNNLSNWSHFYSGNSPLPDDSIIQIVREGNSNKMWICTRNGFARYWNGNWTIYNTSNTPLPSNHAENVYLDTNDSTLWFSTMEGFASLKGGVWNVYSPFNSPCHYSDIESIVVDNNCTLWAATAGGLTSARLPCGQSLGINVSGIVNKSDNTPAQNTMVYIYKLNNNRTDVVQVDNVFTDNLGNYTYYTTDTGKYYFEANVNISQYPNQMIAYHDSSLVIQQTQALNLISNGNYTANIKLKQIVSSLGGCTFNGKLSSSTERIGSVRLILMLNGQPVASTLSNVDGSFKFQNIAPVTYTIWVDKLGLNNSVAPSVTIDCANNNSTYPLTLFSDHLSLGPVNIASNIISNSINIYPNPFTSTTTVEFSEEQKNTTIIIIDVVGKKIKSETFSGKQYILEKGTMQSGIYFVQITDENKNVVNRKIVVE